MAVGDKLVNVTGLKALKNYIVDLLGGKVSTSDIVNDLTSTATDKPLSAAQGKVLNNNLNSVYYLDRQTDANAVHDNASANTFYRTVMSGNSSNVPNTHAFWLEGNRISDNYGIQIAVDSTTGYQYSRFRWGGSWSGWTQLTGDTNITSGADLNSFTNTGHYSCATAVIAQSLSHCPVTDGGFAMDVIKWASTASAQYIIANNRMFFRRTQSESWQELALNDKLSMLYPSSLSNSVILNTYTLNDTSQHSVALTASHDGYILAKVASEQSELNAFIKMAIGHCGYCNTLVLPAYFAEQYASIPCKTGDRISLLYKKNSGSNDATITVINAYS